MQRAGLDATQQVWLRDALAQSDVLAQRGVQVLRGVQEQLYVEEHRGAQGQHGALEPSAGQQEPRVSSP